MEAFNDKLFLLMNASVGASPYLSAVAVFFAQYAVWAVPLGIVWAWLHGGDLVRQSLIEATAAASLALCVAQIVGLLWPHPRPFMINLGTNLLPHVADSSMPSDHLTFIFAVAISFTLNLSTRAAGCWLAVIALPMAWSRIYLGVHFPLDMLGAVLVGSTAAFVAHCGARRFGLPALRVATAIYRPLFAALIRRGWVAP